ncbi:hypothetical protein D3C75_1301500 [compost metagenome]
MTIIRKLVLITDFVAAYEPKYLRQALELTERRIVHLLGRSDIVHAFEYLQARPSGH